jgi:uncharacterized protein
VSNQTYRGYAANIPTLTRAEVPTATGETVAVTSVRGYAALYNVLSNPLGFGYVEVIEAGAFDECLGDDVRCLFNHDSSKILGRTKSGTMKIGTDEIGLWYDCQLPDTQLGKDLAESIARGDIDQSSFQFTITEGDYDWTEEEIDGGFKRWKRTIHKVKRLYDTAPVTYPAYEETSVQTRSLLEEAQAFAARKKEAEGTSMVSVNKTRHEMRRKQLNHS